MADSTDINDNVMPTPQEFCLTVPLYRKFELMEGSSQVATLKYFEGTLDCYCIECGRESVFKSTMVRLPTLGGSRSVTQPAFNYIFSLEFKCTRNENHKIYFIFRAYSKRLEKIGQFPSIADLAMPELKNYRKILGNERYAEFTKGIGLAAHGVGIGAFVYLRRIFEGLIEDARVLAVEQSDWDQTAYEQARMADKIRILKSYLPPFLMENRMLYSIMSIGIHSLSEAECLSAFPIVRLGIELILDSHIQKSEQEQKIQQATTGIAALANALKSGKA